MVTNTEIILDVRCAVKSEAAAVDPVSVSGESADINTLTTTTAAASTITITNTASSVINNSNKISTTSTHNRSNANAAITTANVTNVMAMRSVELPKSSPPPQVIIIPNSQASAVACNAAKKIRRAFSMPRNPFRWSRKLKTANDSDRGGYAAVANAASSNRVASVIGKSSTLSFCVGGGRERSGSFVSLSSYDDKGIKVQPAMQAKSTKIDDKSSDNVNLNNKGKKSSKLTTNVNGKVNTQTSSTATGNASNRVLRRSSFRKFLNRITQHVTTTSSSSNNKHHATANGHATAISTTTDRVPPIGGYQWPNDQTPGVMGLKNHGNTCFMNAVLQCLSHTDILAEYFVLDQYKADLKRRNKINARKFGTKGELTEQLANVLKALWTCKNESDHSTSFKAVVERYGSQFRSSTQHDAQEFLFWLLDKVHEDLNTATKRRYKSVKNNYGRPDEVIAAETLANHIRCNNSFVQAVFQAQFRSSLTCPRCKKQSNTFDPFHCISVQLPQLTQQTVFVTVVYLKQQPRQVRVGLTVTAGSAIVALREQLAKDTGIAGDRMVLVDLQEDGFSRVFYDCQPVNTLEGNDKIYCIEVPPEKDLKPVDSPSTPLSSDLLLLVANVKKTKKMKINEDSAKVVHTYTLERFGAPFCMQVARDCSYAELQKKLLREMASLVKPEVFSYSTPLSEMFQMRLQDPSADPDTYIEQVEHPLLTEMIDLALSVLSSEAGPAHIKLLLEWPDPEAHFNNLSDSVVEHESVPVLKLNKSNDTATLSLEQCLEHYTKAETLSAEDAWRCPHCQQYLPVVKTLGLWSLPDILVVHFKRFRQHQVKGANAAKLTTMVKFPLHSFDMSPHLARGTNESASASSLLTDISYNSTHFRPSPWRKSRPGDSRSSTLSSRDNKETRYDLYAVCYHQGDTLETGHYTAACKNPYDRQWYKFDDQRVTKVSNESLPDEIVNNEAYMLFYQRRASENTECSGSSSNSSDHWVSRIVPPATMSSNTSNPLITDNIKVEAKIEKMHSIEDLVKVEANADLKPIQVLSKEITDELETRNEENLNSGVILAQEVVITNGHTNSLEVLEKDLLFADSDVNVQTQEILDGRNPDKESINQREEGTQDVPRTGETVKIVNSLQSIHESNAKSIQDENRTINKLNNKSPTTLDTVKQISSSQSPDTKTNHTVSNTSSVTTSSDSSISSMALADSLAVSVNGSTNLQNKFNGYTANAAKEQLLSANMKSSSSSIIGSALPGHTYRQPWHGSRSSVSAVESCVTQPSMAATHPSLHLRHSFSTTSNYRLRECTDTLSSLLRNSNNTCSKDTLIFLDQQNHHNHHHGLMEDDDDDDDTIMGSRTLWISPVTPHKLITVSPKN
ncbi:ubiquitin specific protease 15/31 isoform 2-T2 [Glossina fuscipes fuscipes]